MQTLLDSGQIQKLVKAMADDIAADQTFQQSLNKSLPFALVGIRSRGELLAQRLAAELAARAGDPARQPPVGALDITLYRDDLTNRRAITIPQGTDMNFRLDD